MTKNDGVFVDELRERGARSRPSLEDLVSLLASLLHIVPAEQASVVGAPVLDSRSAVGADEVVHEDAAGNNVDRGNFDDILKAAGKDDFAACDGDDSKARPVAITSWGRLEFRRWILELIIGLEGIRGRKVLALENLGQVTHVFEHGGHVGLLIDAYASPFDAADAHLAIILNEDIGLDQQAQNLALDMFCLFYLQRTSTVTDRRVSLARRLHGRLYGQLGTRPLRRMHLLTRRRAERRDRSRSEMLTGSGSGRWWRSSTLATATNLTTSSSTSSSPTTTSGRT